MIIHFSDGSFLTCNEIQFAGTEELIIDGYRRVWTIDILSIETCEDIIPDLGK